MLKTIKTTKHMKLDELIKYVWENHEIFFKEYIKETFFTKDYRSSVTFYKDGSFVTNTCIDSDDLFTVEVEEEITENTEFEAYAIIDEDCQVLQYNNLMSVGKIMEFIDEDSTKELHAVINGKLELIWECEENGSN